MTHEIKNYELPRYLSLPPSCPRLEHLLKLNTMSWLLKFSLLADHPPVLFIIRLRGKKLWLKIEIPKYCCRATSSPHRKVENPFSDKRDRTVFLSFPALIICCCCDQETLGDYKYTLGLWSYCTHKYFPPFN